MEENNPIQSENGKEIRKRLPKPANFVPEMHFSANFHIVKKRNTPRCQAWSGWGGRQCENSPIVGRTTCRMHGGNTPRGIASPNTRTGIYSEYLPLKMRARYEDLLEHPNLYDLRNTVALLDARTIEIFENMEGRDFVSVESAFKKLVDLLMGVQVSEEVDQAMAAVQQAINQNKQDWQVWGEVRNLAEQKRRVIETDRRTQLQAEKIYSLAEIGIILGQVSAIIAQVAYKYMDVKIARKFIEETNRRFEMLFKDR